ncbi:hypothetical protein ACHQM5_017347 [Ranunculus cassubicifolius]
MSADLKPNLGTHKAVVLDRAEKKKISKMTLAWALTHIVLPIPSNSKSKSDRKEAWEIYCIIFDNRLERGLDA